MYTSDDDDQRWHEALDMICHSSARHILDGISFSQFRAHMLGMIEFLLNTIATPAAMRTPEMQQSMATLTALQIWNVTPIPENRFRPQKLARPERNAPCLLSLIHIYGGGTDEGRVADDVVGGGPACSARIEVAQHRLTSGFIRHLFAGDGVGFAGLAVPTAEWYAVFVAHQFAAVVVEHSVAAFDIFEVAQNRACLLYTSRCV